MLYLETKFLNPFTDFGFKKIFGNKQNPEILIDFLNHLLPELQIKTLQFNPVEHLATTDSDRKAIFDLYCESQTGEKFIVELQKVKQNFFKDRSVFYSTFAIQEQALKGDWNFELKAVYTIAILDFVFDDYKNPENKDKVICKVKLMEVEEKTVFYDKLTFVYVQMPNFKKAENELVTHFDKWLYLIQNLGYWKDEPTDYKEEVFTKILEIAQLAKLNRQEINSYETSLKVYRDNMNTMADAKQEAEEKGLSKGLSKGLKKGKKQGLKQGKKEGKKEGLEEGKQKIALKMLKLGLDKKQIAEITGLSIIEIKKLENNKK